MMVVVVLLVGTLGLGAADRLHLVKRGDTLYGVALKYGVGVPALAERNGMKPTAGLLVGQKLAIPSSRSVSRASKPALPTEVQTAIDSARVKSRRWNRVVIHHSGTAEGTIKGMNEYHLKERHMENGLAYHFVIGNGHGMGDGEIYVGNRWKKQINGGHLASELQNSTSLGICLVGNFDAQPPTSRQMKSLTALVEALQTRCRLSDKAVVTHQQINTVHTRCPGTKFPMKSFMAGLSAKNH
jgi:LysM repeat protein